MPITAFGTVDLEGANDDVFAGPIGDDTYVIGTLQEKQGTIELIACEPVRNGTNKFVARLTSAPPPGNTILLGFLICEP